MKISTAGLAQIIKSSKDINTFLQENEESITNPTLGDYLQQLLALKGLKRQEVINNAELESNYINQLFSGIKTKPGRNQILSLAFSFGLDVEETDRLLKIAHTGSLYPKNKRDAIIIYSLAHGQSLTQTNDVLSALNLRTLSDDAKY